MKREPRCAPETVQRVLAATHSGATREQIAGTVGCSPSTVSVAWKVAGISRSEAHHHAGKTAPVSDERIVELTRQGLSAADIADILGCNDRTVVRARVRAGIAAPPCVSMSAEKIAAAEEMLNDGWSFREVARTLGVAYESVQRRFPGRGWSRRQCAEHVAAIRLFGKEVGL